ncbi:UNVERIFIED_CONTAM: hypothetical protein Sradi_1541500 [Sesamum radiatum]|uniref:Uncharacterized protein n=1 Tax=Sesamum radiatum TaxID=300843 RepID=A0AAW2U8G5_SESRA
MLQPAREVALITWSQQVALNDTLAMLQQAHAVSDWRPQQVAVQAGSELAESSATCDLLPAIH